MRLQGAYGFVESANNVLGCENFGPKVMVKVFKPSTTNIDYFWSAGIKTGAYNHPTQDLLEKEVALQVRAFFLLAAAKQAATDNLRITPPADTFAFMNVTLHKMFILF